MEQAKGQAGLMLMTYLVIVSLLLLWQEDYIIAVLSTSPQMSDLGLV